jgi:hypothetical protein
VGAEELVAGSGVDSGEGLVEVGVCGGGRRLDGARRGRGIHQLTGMMITSMKLVFATYRMQTTLNAHIMFMKHQDNDTQYNI